MKSFTGKTILAALSVLALQAQAENTLVEVGIQQALVPFSGFDDNDTVEATIDGELPNSCYALERSEILRSGNTFTIKQFAVKQSDGLCSGLDKNDPRLLTTVPFTETVKLGNLSQGDYSITYHPTPDTERARAFNVAKAAMPMVDTLPYAIVTNVGVSDFVGFGQHVFVQLNGTLNNSCYQLNDSIKIQRLDDVVVVLPTVKIMQRNPCLMYVRTFSKMVDVGVLPPNRYLIHVRSMNGKSMNRVLSVNDAQ